jgi:hypothetical protein
VINDGIRETKPLAFGNNRHKLAFDLHRIRILFEINYISLVPFECTFLFPSDPIEIYEAETLA